MISAAREATPPVGAVDVCAMVDDARAYRAAWLVDGRLRVPFGPAFSRPRDCHRFVELMKGGFR